MARRRLNKKVALMGTTVLLLLVMAAVFVILHLNRDPAPFIADGDAAWAAKDYPTARENYGKAYSLAGDPEMKVDLLFKLSEAYRELGQWDKVQACWDLVVTADPRNVKALLGRLKYSYILADSLGSAGRSVSGYWDEVHTRAKRALEVVTEAGLLNASRADWEPSFGTVKDRAWSRGAATLGPHLHFVKGRAALELASMGAVTSPEQLLQEAQTDLEEARKLDASNAQVYRYLASVFIERGKMAASVGNRDEQTAAEKQADDILTEGVKAAGESPEAHIYLLTRKLTVAQQGTIVAARQQIGELESQYESLTTQFASNAQSYAAKSQFYSLFATYLDAASARSKLDKAISAAERAQSLDGQNAEYVILLASLQYRKSSIYHDPLAMKASIDQAEKGLVLADANDSPGPRQNARRLNRLKLCTLLARGCVEQILSLPASDPAKDDLLARAEMAVHQIEQIQGSGENPEVLTWQGMLDLARGRTDKAVKSLYAAYEQIKAARPADQRDPYLSLTLATIFKDTSETGAVIDFLGTALAAGIIQTKPQTILDYGDALVQAGSEDGAIGAANTFEERFGANDRSRALRVRALIAKGYISEADEAVVKLKADAPETLALNLDLIRAKTTQLISAIHQQEAAGAASSSIDAMNGELLSYHRREADLTQRLLAAEPDRVEEKHVVRLCESLIERGDTATVKTVVDAWLKQSPDSPGGLFYKALVAEPDPQNCPEARRLEIQEQAIRSIHDPVRRSLELGAFYRQRDKLDQAVAQWRSVLDATASQPTGDTPAYLVSRKAGPRQMAVGYLFDLARHQKNWTLAEEMVELAKHDNLDDCGGHLYAARLAFARESYTTALADLDECLKQRPVFSYGYMLRGNVKAELGRQQESVEDIREAARLNPMDPTIAKSLANTLYVRNEKLGADVSSEQQAQVKQALERAIHLNPRDVPMLSVYADLVSDDDPMKAMAIRQTIQNNAPNLRNAVMLGRLAAQVAQRETDESRKRAFFAVAQTAFEQARKMDPSDPFMLDNYAAYYRILGQNDKAEQLLMESNDSRLLWRHYFRVRDFAEAKRLLTKLYADTGARLDALKGLLLVAEETGDRPGVKKYSEELLSLEDSAVNRLAQLRAYLNVGLVSEAEQRLDSFKQKYPNDGNIALLEAQIAKRQGQLQRAMDLIDRRLESNQQDPAAWRLRGEISLLMGDADRAILDFRKSRALADDPVTTIGLAKAYLWSGRNDEAVAELQHAAAQPNAPLEAMTLLEATYRKLGRNDALKRLYADVLAETPDSVFWLNRAGSFALDQGRYEQAEELFVKAILLREQGSAGRQGTKTALDVEYSTALDGRLRAIIQSAGDPAAGGWHPERLDRVFQEGDKYVDTPYAPIAFFRMAEAKKKLGDLAAARDYGRKAAEKAWSNERLAVEVLLRLYVLLGEPEASSYCRQRLATEPDSLPANFVLFSLAEIQDKYGDAANYIDKCIQVAGPDSDAGAEYTIRKADLLTTAYKKTSDKSYLAKAIAVYESLHAKMPKNSSVLNNLAYMLAQNDQRLEEALGYARTAVEQNPDVAGYRDTYAFALYKNGKYDEAAQAVAAAIQQYEIDGAAPVEVYEHLGMVNEALGQKSKARDAYRRALETAGDTASAVVKQRINAAIQRLQ